MSKPINVFDFDKTIYNGDSSIDFYLYCLSKKPLLLKYLPLQIWHLILLSIGKEDRSKFKSNFFMFLKNINDPDSWAYEFWDKHEKNIKKWYRDISRPGDVIISASPEFLLKPISTRLRANLIATIMDPNTGEIVGKNNRGVEKLVRLKQQYGDTTVDNAYSDSLTDKPLLDVAKTAYVIKGRKVINYQDFLRNKKVPKTTGINIEDALE